MNTFVSLIIAVFGILQIFLFFKLWGMTNNVKKIMNQLDENKIEMDISKLILLGKNDEALRVYEEDFLIPNMIENFYKKLPNFASEKARREAWGSFIENAEKKYNEFAQINNVNPKLDFEKFKSMDYIRSISINNFRPYLGY